MSKRPESIKYLFRNRDEATRAAACLRKHIRGVRITVTRDGDVKVRPITGRYFFGGMSAVTALAEKRCKL